MPLIDMPLAELRSYMGRNPKPTDFEDYWTKALAEFDATDPCVKLTPGPALADFVTCQEMKFTGVGGARIHAKLLSPAHQENPGPGLCCFHGYSMDSGDWTSYLGYVAKGFTVAAMDARGQGGKSEDKGGVLGNTLNGHIIRGLDDSPEKLLYRSIFLDTAQLARIVMAMPNVDETRVGATGWSQGGGLTLACAALEPRISRCAPVYPFLCDYKRVWEMDLAKQAYDEMRNWFRRFDPRHEREDEVWTRLGYIDTQHLASRIRAKTLMVTGLMDDICPPSTQFAAFNKILSAKDMLIYPDFGHESLPGAPDKIYQFLTAM